jgi:predicted nucleotidyltransferase
MDHLSPPSMSICATGVRPPTLNGWPRHSRRSARPYGAHRGTCPVDARSLALGANFTFDTNLGPLDLLAWLEPLGTYESVIDRAERMDLGSIRVLVIGLDDLIAIKRHINRPKDQVAAVQLEALRRLRDTGS